MATATKKPTDCLVYKGKPLLREDEKLYYGDFDDNYVCLFVVEASKKVKDKDIATSVSVSLLEKRGDGIESAKLVRKAHRDSLYAALDVGVFWLHDTLEMEKEFNGK
jgi:hypothetical protein